MNSPEPSFFLDRWTWKLSNWYHSFSDKYVYVIEFGDIKIKDGWAKVNQFGTFTFNGTEHDNTDAVLWYGKPSILVRPGIRPPIKPSKILAVIKEPSDDDELLAVDGVLAKVKMNTRNLEQFVKGVMSADIMTIIGIVIIALVVIDLLFQFDVLKSPARLEQTQAFTEILNNTRRIR